MSENVEKALQLTYQMILAEEANDSKRADEIADQLDVLYYREMSSSERDEYNRLGGMTASIHEEKKMNKPVTVAQIKAELDNYDDDTEIYFDASLPNSVAHIYARPIVKTEVVGGPHRNVKILVIGKE